MNFLSKSEIIFCRCCGVLVFFGKEHSSNFQNSFSRNHDPKIHFFVFPKIFEKSKKKKGFSEPKNPKPFPTTPGLPSEVRDCNWRPRAATPSVETEAEPPEFAEPPELPSAKTWRDLAVLCWPVFFDSFEDMGVEPTKNRGNSENPPKSSHLEP